MGVTMVMVLCLGIAAHVVHDSGPAEVFLGTVRNRKCIDSGYEDASWHRSLFWRSSVWVFTQVARRHWTHRDRFALTQD